MKKAIVSLTLLVEDDDELDAVMWEICDRDAVYTTSLLLNENISEDEYDALIDTSETPYDFEGEAR